MQSDLKTILPAIGYLGIFGIIFAESGLLFGFFFPGDSLLFTAGFLASQKIFDINILVLVSCLGAIIGDSVGYSFGKKIGPRLFKRKNSLLFSQERLQKTRLFYQKHGKKTIVLARFIPVIRTFAPIVAGIGEMEYKTFLSYNLIGGIFWGSGITLAGYHLGNLIPNIDKYLLPLILIIILISSSPTIIHILKDDGFKKQILILLKTKLALAQSKSEPTDSKT